MSRRTALVTGASSGIGLAFAKRLAADGYDLVIVARDAERLKSLAGELTTETEVLPADLIDPEQLAQVERRVADGERPIDLLVNNAGFGTNGRFAEMPVDTEEQQIRLNITALMRLTHAALGAMVERGSGGIINLASVGGFTPAPGNATYAATKAFVVSFTEALSEELRGTGVKIQVLAPGFTRTEFQQRAGIDRGSIPSAAWGSAEDVVDTSLKALARGKVVCVPGVLNRSIVASTHITPRGLVRRIAGMITRRYTPE